jgi:hypothetical protein
MVIFHFFFWKDPVNDLWQFLAEQFFMLATKWSHRAQNLGEYAAKASIKGYFIILD